MGDLCSSSVQLTTGFKQYTMYKGSTILFFVIIAVSFGFHIDESHKEGKKDYNFDYTVHDPHTHDYHSHQESSKDGVVNGYYSVKDADGSLREVHYTAHPKTGFKAIVTKNGVQIHPHTQGSAHEDLDSHIEHNENYNFSEQHQPAEHHFQAEHHFYPEHLYQHEHHYQPGQHEHSFAEGLSSLHDFGHISNEGEHISSENSYLHL